MNNSQFYVKLTVVHSILLLPFSPFSRAPKWLFPNYLNFVVRGTFQSVSYNFGRNKQTYFTNVDRTQPTLCFFLCQENSPKLLYSRPSCQQNVSDCDSDTTRTRHGNSSSKLSRPCRVSSSRTLVRHPTRPSPCHVGEALQLEQLARWATACLIRTACQ